ncbi:MAG: septation ring formation regulator EzrA [Rubrivivax sp.]|nr:MAG: septation ring formation regulator EzrA [Rubrivivax sp.]
MKPLALVLAIFLIAIQAQLWVGRGSIPYVAHLREEVAAEKAENDEARARNNQLQAELRDLREGLEMVEEKARFELGMIKADEVFVPLTPRAAASLPASASR